MLSDYFGINIRTSWAYWCVPLVGSLLALLLRLAVHPERRYGRFFMVLPCIILFCTIFAEVPYVNWACTVQAPQYEYAVVTEKEADKGARSRSYYYINVKMHDGSTARLRIVSALFSQVQPNDSVTVCRRKSVFGVEYWFVC